MRMDAGDADLILPRGVTGFRDVREAALPEVDLKEFVACCHAAARSCSAKVLTTAAEASPTSPANFGIVAMEVRDRRIDVLVNAVYPLVGFVRRPETLGATHVFVDELQFASALEDTGDWRVLPKRVLESSIRAESLAELAAVEQRQIAYWKSQRLGDVIFNRWD